MNDDSPVIAAVRNADATPSSTSEGAPDSAQPSAALFDLSSMSVIDVTGADAEPFLQGQFCNDLKLVQPASEGQTGLSELNGYCTPKGRLLALPLVIGTAQGFRLLVPEPIQESFLKRLRMFVMRADVVFTPRADLRVLGLEGEDDRWAGLLPTGVSLLTDALRVSGSADSQALRWFSGERGVARWMLILPQGLADSLRDAVDDSEDFASVAALESWILGNIHAGVPDIGLATADAFIPQMVNLQQVGGLSFTKGCYPGQEIVARMQYLGKLKRHMVHLRLPSGIKKPEPGDTIATAESQAAAEVVSAVDTGQGIHLLAVVRIGIDPTTLSVEGHSCTPVELPYELAQS